MSFSKHGLAVVNVGGVGLYHYARILQRANEADVIPIPVVCLTDRDVVPNEADYIKPPENGKPRFDKDYTPEALAELVNEDQDHPDRFETPAIIVVGEVVALRSAVQGWERQPGDAGVPVGLAGGAMDSPRRVRPGPRPLPLEGRGRGVGGLRA